MYDCIIIGGGLSGLTCGLKCAGEGLRTLVISGGMCALHFSSGSIDVLGYDELGQEIYEPFVRLVRFIKDNPEHPYSKIGIDKIRESLGFFRDELAKENLNLYHNGDMNHIRFTALGVMKPTYFSQESVFNERLMRAFENKSKITILNFYGYRDCFAELSMDQLKKNPLMQGIGITVGKIDLSRYVETEKNLHEFRSIDLARIFDSEKFLPQIAEEIKMNAGDSGIVSLPAFIGINNYTEIHRKLEEMTGLLIYEVPTLPPSILGMRIDNALRTRFAALGGEYSGGDRVTGGEIFDQKLNHIHTDNYRNARIQSKFFVLSTGSFFSGGLRSEYDRFDEPVLNLKVSGAMKRNGWYSQKFFDKKSHPFLEFGVATDKSFNPEDKKGKTVKNLFCTGALLSGYNPIKEGSGGGVAIAGGYFAAQKIIKECKKN